MKVLRNDVNADLWEPIVVQHPNITKPYRPSETKSFLDYQETSEKYEMPGLMPKDPNRPKSGFKPY